VIDTVFGYRGGTQEGGYLGNKVNGTRCNYEHGGEEDGIVSRVIVEFAMEGVMEGREGSEERGLGEVLGGSLVPSRHHCNVRLRFVFDDVYLVRAIVIFGRRRCRCRCRE